MEFLTDLEVAMLTQTQLRAYYEKVQQVVNEAARKAYMGVSGSDNEEHARYVVTLRHRTLVMTYFDPMVGRWNS